MKICYISKYPPIEGGVSSDNYWIAKELGERSHEIFFVTNSWQVEEDHREYIPKEELSLLEPKNVFVYSTIKDLRSPIVRSHYFSEKILNIILDIDKRENFDLLFSNYLLPYGIAGYLAKLIIKKPHILRHAGSDIGKLYTSKFLKTIFLAALKDADKIVGGGNLVKIFDEELIDKNKIFTGRPIVNPKYFHPDVNALDLFQYSKKIEGPIFLYIGKISDMKKTYAYVNAINKIKIKKFTMLFVIGNGRKAKELKEHITSLSMLHKCIFLPFQPPWRIPSILKASNCIVSPESEEPPFLPQGTHYPKIAREAMACGKCAIIGKEVSKKGLYSNMENQKNILVVDPNNEEDFKNKLELVIDNPSIAEEIGKNAYVYSKEKEYFKNYIDELEKLFEQTVKKK